MNRGTSLWNVSTIPACGYWFSDKIMLNYEILLNYKIMLNYMSCGAARRCSE
jgi:hypothetical protein